MTMQEVRAELKNRNTLEELFDLVKTPQQASKVPLMLRHIK